MRSIDPSVQSSLQALQPTAQVARYPAFYRISATRRNEGIPIGKDDFRSLITSGSGNGVAQTANGTA